MVNFDVVNGESKSVVVFQVPNRIQLPIRVVEVLKTQIEVHNGAVYHLHQRVPLVKNSGELYLILPKLAINVASY